MLNRPLVIPHVRALDLRPVGVIIANLDQYFEEFGRRLAETQAVATRVFADYLFPEEEFTLDWNFPPVPACAS